MLWIAIPPNYMGLAPNKATRSGLTDERGFGTIPWIARTRPEVSLVGCLPMERWT